MTFNNFKDEVKKMQSDEKMSQFLDSLEDLIKDYSLSPTQLVDAVVWFLSTMPERTEASPIIWVGEVLKRYGTGLQLVEEERVNKDRSCEKNTNL